MGRKIENAEIYRVDISNADHGALTMWIGIHCGEHSAQMFGGWRLGKEPNAARKFSEQKFDALGYYVWRVIQTVLNSGGELDQIIGKAIRVDRDDSRIHGIGHFIEDNWFYPEKEMDQ